MAFLSGDTLKDALELAINNFDEGAIEQASYALSLGGEHFETDSEKGKVASFDSSNKYVVINPGQFCLLLTQETVSIPKNLMGFISIKANEKFKGLINVSGFHLDPGFSGRILFSVYNAGPSSITLKSGQRYFLLWLASLTNELTNEELYSKKRNSHQNQDGIPPRYIDSLRGGELTSPHALAERIKGLETKAGFIITLLVALVAKYALDWNAAREGYVKRIDEESLVARMSTAHSQIDSQVMRRLDSLSTRLKTEEMKSGH